MFHCFAKSKAHAYVLIIAQCSRFYYGVYPVKHLFGTVQPFLMGTKKANGGLSVQIQFTLFAPQKLGRFM